LTCTVRALVRDGIVQSFYDSGEDGAWADTRGP
jgi:hypothetical protein